MVGVAGELAAANEVPIFVLARGRLADWEPIPNATLIPVPTGRWRNLKLIALFRRMRRVFVIGADCLDGHYHIGNSVRLISAADIAARTGAISTLVGSSYKEGAAQESIEAIRALDPRVRLCSRDPRSAKRVKDLTGRDPILVADAAFLLKPTAPAGTQAAEVVRWIDDHRREGRVVLGVNFNRQVLGKKPTPEQVREFLNAYAEGIGSLLRKMPQVDVAFIPHDYRGEDSDLDHAIALHKAIGNPQRAVVLTDRCRASELKHIASRLDCMLTGRMHFAIAGMGSGIPAACITYQNKFEGLFDHFSLDPITMAPDQINAESLCDFLTRFIEQRERIADHIKSKLADVKRLSRTNLALDATP